MARFVETGIEGVILVEPEVHRDERGFLLETYHAAAYRDGGIPETFVQDNHSRSAKGTLRGLHGQFPRAQGKLVRAVEGEIYDVAVDVRRGSPTFGRFYAATLSADNFCQLYIPPGMVHGFCVTSDVAQVEYKCTGFYRREEEFSIAWAPGADCAGAFMQRARQKASRASRVPAGRASSRDRPGTSATGRACHRRSRDPDRIDPARSAPGSSRGSRRCPAA